MFLVHLNIFKGEAMERVRWKTSEKKRVEQIMLLPFNVRNYLNRQFHSSHPSPWSGNITVNEQIERETQPSEWDQVVGNEFSNLRSAPRRVSINRYTYTWVSIRDALLCPSLTLLLAFLSWWSRANISHTKHFGNRLHLRGEILCRTWFVQLHHTELFKSTSKIYLTFFICKLNSWININYFLFIAEKCNSYKYYLI